MRIYTYADRQGNRMFTRTAERLDTGIERHDNAFSMYPFELFMPAATHVHHSRSIYGQPLSRIEFADLAGFTEFAQNGQGVHAHGMSDPVIQWIGREFRSELTPDTSLFKILNFDIEVAHDDGFPDPDEAKDEVLSIRYKVFGQPGVSLGTKRSKRKTYMQCADEADLLKQFLKLYERINPDILTGWNIMFFDVPYIINRVTKVLGKEYLKALSPFSKKARNFITPREDERNGNYYKILGVTIIDYLDLYKKFSPSKRESYKLGYIAELEVGAAKVSFSDYAGSLMRLYRGEPVPSNDSDATLVQRVAWACLQCLTTSGGAAEKDFTKATPEAWVALAASGEHVELSRDTLDTLASAMNAWVESYSYDKFLEYNEIDVDLVERIDNSLKFMDNLIAVAFMAKCRIEDALATVKPWDALVYNALLDKGMQPPPQVDHSSVSIVGGYVKEPVPGLKKWVITLDLKSLYPNIVRTLNMSPETKVASGEPIIEDILAGKPLPVQPGCAIAANGSQYTQEFTGIIPQIMSYLLDTRDVVKDDMKAKKREQQELVKRIEVLRKEISMAP